MLSCINLSILDLRFGFLVNNCVDSRLETSGNPIFDQTITKISFGGKHNKPDQEVNEI